jgi:CRP-like cAMP-binding protein
LSEAFLRELLEHLHLPLAWAHDLKGHVKLRHVAPDEGLIREGDPGDSLFIVLEGQVRAVRPVQQSIPYTGLCWETLGILEKNDWFGEASLLTGAPRSATVVADMASELLEIPKQAFEKNIRLEPEIMELLVDLMERRARSSSDLQPAQRREQWLIQIRDWFGV